ncbi:hypothetical protein [Bradyrhizobium canariense]|uniref:Uncharacterized protein n=1 Tax=Bradyrhizobium canariense TaxID=255045 RepID=A0A1X3FUP7_9BRAD|nr:hypothetical protein [Bradyrhizobium canariense]OSI70489.1 hypothetical protein BSZ22_14815 [Bradyrhizobium canariense]OSI75308.1 hypothetical protein BSZ23_29335 [Bradyrhizobium canariense]OSI85837.1 hypothetical protein BSZ25_31555 [Bradyrhizobium canariense]OSI88216.1 hypothetical protein BSZ24_24915 [Bradyrhizobium canariense]OSI99041.1 hypothetical protein BSZ16_30765 [Bradyrhizobium canariense]
MVEVLRAALFGSLAFMATWVTQANACGNGPLQCEAVYGIFAKKSKERLLIEELYSKLVKSADNSLTKLYADPLSTAVAEVKGKASDADVKFWVIVTNPTALPQTGKFYVMAAKVATEVTDLYKGRDWLNCPLEARLCKNEIESKNIFIKPDDDRKPFRIAIHELKKTGEIILQKDIDVPPNSIRTLGLAIPDADDGDEVVIALLGGQAGDKIKIDEADVIRLGFALR